MSARRQQPRALHRTVAAEPQIATARAPNAHGERNVSDDTRPVAWRGTSLEPWCYLTPRHSPACRSCCVFINTIPAGILQSASGTPGTVPAAAPAHSSQNPVCLHGSATALFSALRHTTARGGGWGRRLRLARRRRPPSAADSLLRPSSADHGSAARAKSAKIPTWQPSSSRAARPRRKRARPRFFNAWCVRARCSAGHVPPETNCAVDASPLAHRAAVTAAALRAPRSILIQLPHSPPSCLHRAPQGTHQPLPFAAPRPHRRFAYPPPPPRPARLRLVPRPPPPPTTTARPPRLAAARFEPATRAVACWRSAPAGAEPAGTTPLRSFSTASALTRAPPVLLLPVQVDRCAGAHGTAGTGWHGGLRAQRLP